MTQESSAITPESVLKKVLQNCDQHTNRVKQTCACAHKTWPRAEMKEFTSHCLISQSQSQYILIVFLTV